MGEKLTPFQVIPVDATAATLADQRAAYVQQLLGKWEWLLEGTSAMKKSENFQPIPEHLWPAMAILFENQHMAWLETQKNKSEGVTMTDDLAFPLRYALPIIRKVYPQLWINRVASLQPLPPPSGGTGQIFYQDFERSDVNPATPLTESDSDYAANIENGVPKRIKMTMKSETVRATKDILGATWSSEVQEDARGALNIDVESELVNAMASEILREQEMRCLADMWNGATAGCVTWDKDIPDSGNYIAQTYYETLAHAFVDAETLIMKKRYREAEWFVVGIDVYSYIAKMNDFREVSRTTSRSAGSVGVRYMGTMRGRWDVYLSMYMGANRALCGTYPASVTDTSFILAPYIPLQVTPLIYAEFMPYNDATMPGAYVNTDKWSRNVRTRYAKKVVVGDLLSQVIIS